MTSRLRECLTKRPKLSPWQTLLGGVLCPGWKDSRLQCGAVEAAQELRAPEVVSCPEMGKVMASLWASAHLSVPRSN